MDLDQREMPKDEAKPVAQTQQDIRNDGLRGGAVGTLVVAILDDRHGRVVVAQDWSRDATGTLSFAIFLLP